MTERTERLCAEHSPEGATDGLETRSKPSGVEGGTLRSIADLADAGLISADRAKMLADVEARYSVGVTPEVAALINPRDANDPIARQFLPDSRELMTLAHERADPIGDEAHSPLPGLVHRYPDRVLLKLLSVCPVYCRFCFRRETVGRGKGDVLSDAALAAAFAYVAAHPRIFEVILTGGDPLALSARRLMAVSEALTAVPHVEALRVHSRAPTVAPELVTPDRLAALTASGKALHIVLHVNHARELTQNARAAIARMQGAGASLLAQTVLLAGVNDHADTLEALMRALVSLRVKPYYLHHPDLAPGTGHFRMDLGTGGAIYAELGRRLSGLALPNYVLDIPGGYGKAPVAEGRVARGVAGWRVKDRFGAVHDYPRES